MLATRRQSKAMKAFQWPAPVRGWVASANLLDAPIDAAERLDNFYPTAQGCRLRYGRVLHATLDDVPRRLMSYAFGAEAFFASTDAAIFEIATPASATVTPVATVTGLGSGDWSHTHFATAGGSFLVAVNGADPAIYFDGAEFNPITDVAIRELAYDALTADFTVGETLTGGTSGATATIVQINPTSATAGVLKLSGVTGTFQDNETITDSATGSADADGADAAASSVTVTNVATSALSQVWAFKQRLFFIEEGTQSAWYLPVDAIGGAASELPLGSLFKGGGSLLFGATWSLDSGEGLDDVCLFVTDQGEMAVYTGTNPASASTWSLSGVYRIGKPVNKHAAFQAGGELYIITDDGIVPVSQAINRDRGGLALAAITYPIEDAWNNTIAARTSDYPITATLWQSQNYLIVGTPETDEGTPVCFVSNVATGAWARYTNWDVRISGTFDSALYIGSSDNCIYRAEVGGTDAGTAYTGHCIPKFSTMGTPAYKVANMVGLVARAAASFDYSVKLMADYAASEIPTPPPVDQDTGAAVWGTSLWGGAGWQATGMRIGQQKWKSSAAQGFAISPGFAMTSNQTPAPVIEVVSISVLHEAGAIL